MGRNYGLMRDQAFRRKGEDWANLIVGFEVAKRVLPVVAVGALLGVVGYYARVAWLAMVSFGAPDTSDVPEPVGAPAIDFGAVPGWLWIAAAVLFLVCVWLFRPGRIVTPSGRRMRVVQVALIVFAFAGMVGYGLSVLTA